MISRRRVLQSSLLLGCAGAGAGIAHRYEVINVSDFGVVGDGVTDNSIKLIEMRDKLIARGRKHPYEIVFQKGRYLYTNNRWLMGLMDVKVKGNNTELQCISPSASIYDYAPFPRDGMFCLQGDRSGLGGMEYVSGSRIQSAPSGQEFLEFFSPELNSTIMEGDNVLIHGYAQQASGYTPNLRYFEWNKVAAVNGSKVILESGLKNSYSSSWNDLIYNDTPIEIQEPVVKIGAARILKLSNRPQRVGVYNYAERIELSNITILDNPMFSDKYYGLTLQAREVVIDNLDLSKSPQTLVIARECEFFSLSNSKICLLYTSPSPRDRG